LDSNDLKVEFEGGELTATAIDAEGDPEYLGTLLAGGTYNDFATEADIADAIQDIKDAKENFRTASTTLASNLFIINTRSDFTQSMVDVLGSGADELTSADMNEESANMLMLQTRQQLGISSLQLASEAAQSILKLF
jgi:flagellin-like hook-associated protein FlgL